MGIANGTIDPEATIAQLGLSGHQEPNNTLNERRRPRRAAMDVVDWLRALDLGQYEEAFCNCVA